ncbi:type I polyketide synthase [Streptomyces sp. V1I1]|uniref:type I polyketide synthase n=1 Tax=Streptomyces sp. V1I1 TaxID=3042272 RepID=UPI002789D106|nr:type I polyketide synthase [Streptomyces sp. V1I1]MDQ0945800.1 acyl transferase domain-containing protein/acyl carrier protein [Streptomyces sp. V1I1]
MVQRDHPESAEHKRIAVVGLGCRLPGDVDSPAALWRLLADGRDAVGNPPAGRTGSGASGAHHGSVRSGNGNPMARQGGYLRDVSGFDADFFGVSGREADVLDPQHRLLLEVAWEALEHAGLPPDRLTGSSTGMYLGISYNDFYEGLAGHPLELEGSLLTNGHCVAAGRISYLLGLHGPCVALDTACSSSLVALHLACRALGSGECDLALAGGVTLILGSRTMRSFARMGMLSPTGRCHTFDAAADGFVRGEGCGVVVLKRLADALRDGDRVLAVIRGSAVNQDGRSDGLAAPSAAAQQALFREALERAGTDQKDVGLIETHGTGTPIGDPIEFSSLAQVYGVGPDRCALGSVKTNLGHLEPASGITGLIKAVLCLQRGLVPPNLHFTKWNPAIAAEGTRFFVPTRLTEWPTRSSPRLAAVSSFGYSGTNAHVVLEQAPAAASSHRPVTPSEGTTPEVFLVPAGSARVLPLAAERLADWLEGDGSSVPLRDVAHTLALRRSAGRGRLGAVAASRHDLVRALRSFAAGQAHPGLVSGAVAAGVSRRPVWVFSGQGSQWAGMGRTLLEYEPVFAAALTEADALIGAEAGFSVLDMVSRGDPVTECSRVQPLLFAVQIALAALWRAHGVEPAAVVGHSMGEVAAAVVAGALTLADGVRVICRRSSLLTRIAGAGAMATVSLDRAAVEAELDTACASGAVSVAVLAAPGSTVVAGETREVERLVSAWESRAIPAHLIAVDVASHSPQVDPLLSDLRTALADLAPEQPRVPFYSTVLSDPRRIPDFDAAYWCANLRHPVRFASAIAAAAADRHHVYVEVSPHPVVTRSVTDSLPRLVENAVVLPTLRREEEELTTFRTQLAALHCAGVDVDWSKLYLDAELSDVPFLTFDRQRHWADVAPFADAPAGTGGGLPGTHAEVPGEQVRHYWRGDAGTAAVPWLADHRVHADPVFPGAGYCAVALTVACEVFGAPEQEIEVTDVRFLELLQLSAHTEVVTSVTVTAPDRAECEIFGRGEDGGWVRQATAELHHVGVPPLPPTAKLTAKLTALPAQHPVALDPASLYAGMRARGIEHGPAFTGIMSLRVSRDGESVWARVELPAAATPAPDVLRIHPVLVDCCAQALVAGLIREHGQGLVLPVGVKAVRILGDPTTAVYCHARVVEEKTDGVTGHVRLLDEAGKPVLSIDSLQLVRHGAPGAAGVDGWFLETRWQRAALPETKGTTPQGSWLVIGEADGSAQALAVMLHMAGATTDVLDTPVGDHPLGLLKDALVDRWADHPSPPDAVVLLCAPPADGGDPAARALRRTRRLLDTVQAAVSGCPEPPRLFVVTRGAQTVDPAEPADPGQSALRGVVRVLAYEHPEVRATHLDADPADAALHDVAAELLNAGPEDEVALRGGIRHIARLDYAPLTETERHTATTRPVRYGTDRFRLRVGRFGDLGSLQLAVTDRPAPGPGEVELRVRAAAVNFRDVLTAMGLLSADEDARYRIGFECAGTVTAVGPDVTAVRVGDPVLAVDLRGGAFGSFVTVPVHAVAPVPAGIDATAAAGLPAAYVTAWYALRHVARLTARERVLIHSATGGTGLAAIGVARMLGAEVLATAGNAEKRAYLRGMGIEHVMDSRSLHFTEQTRAATGGEGVDVVLNSLSGAAIRSGLETLRPFGRFVELGVRDILSDTSVGLSPFRHNITLSTVDLIEVQHKRSEVFTAVLREVLSAVASGRLKPLPHRSFPLAEVTEAFRFMAGASHIGKLILTVPDRGDTTAVIPEGPSVVHPDSAYIVTGGLRGVGLATARWLAEQGAGHIVLNGRSPGSESTERTLEELRAHGTRITVALGDIAEPGTAERLVTAATANGLPLRGLIHAAMVLDDAAVTNISEDQLLRVWHPKATGAWRLHQATATHAPDWFVVFSSMASLLGNPGQGAYAAANSWLDGFATWRTGRGMPTLSVNWGAWGETGAAVDFAERGYQTIPTKKGLQALNALLVHQRTRTAVIPGKPDTWILPAVRHSSLFSLLAEEPSGNTEQDDSIDIRTELSSIPAGLARRTALEAYIADHIRAVLRLGNTALEPQTPLKSLGFDSLLSLELRTRLETGLGIKVAANFVYQHPTLAALATGLADHMGLTLQDPAGS